MTGLEICRWLWGAFFVVWLLWAIRTKPTQSRESLSSRLPYSVLAFAAFYLVFTRGALAGWLLVPILPPRPEVAALGVAITAAGLGFAVWARAYLGGNWSGMVTVKVGHELILTGPYRWVRHPIYSGMILALLGTAVSVGQVRGFVAVVILYIGLRFKSRIEERAMTRVFGSDYEAYSRSTGAILPGLQL